jgi:hypothetical protein
LHWSSLARPETWRKLIPALYDLCIDHLLPYAMIIIEDKTIPGANAE